MVDVGLTEDLIYGLKNLCAIESHAKSSYYMTHDKKWKELNDIIRDMRSKWLEKVVKKENSELWCCSKHLLNSFMSMEEVANRLSGEESEDANKDAEMLLGLFLALNELKEVEKTDSNTNIFGNIKRGFDKIRGNDNGGK